MSRLPKTISVEKLDNSVLFTFAQNQHYLYDGTIEVPFNSLSIIADKSEAITLRKSASNDIFISAPWENFDINASNKEDVVDALTDILYDETGGGVSREEVEDMIDAATSGIPSSQTIEQLRTDVNTISGNVQTLSGEVATKADASDLQALSEKVDTKLDASAYTPTDLSEYWTSAETKSYVDDALDDYYDKDYVDAALADKLDASAYTPVDLSDYWTSAETQNAINAATSGIPSSQVIEALRNDLNTVSGDVENKQDKLQYYSEAEFPVDGGGRGMINIANGKTYISSIEADAGNTDGGTYARLYAKGDAGENTLNVSPTGVTINDAKVLTENDININDLWNTIDEKEEVVASALTELNLRLNEDEEVTAAALNDLNDRIGSGGGALFVDFDDLMNNMNDEKWDELVNTLQNNKPIFYGYDFSEGDITDAGQSPVDGYVYIDQTEGEESAEITLKQLFNGGYRELIITKNDSEDYEISDDFYEYQPMGDYQPTLQAGSGISIDSNNVISVTGAPITVDSELDEASNNPVANSAVTTVIIDDEEVISRAINELNDRLVAVESGGSSVTVDMSLDSGSTNPVANSAITAALDAKAELSNTITDVRVYDSLYGRALQKKVGNGGYGAVLYYGLINGTNIVDSSKTNIPNFQLVEKSAITSAITSASTNDEVAGAKAVYDALDAKADASTTYTKTEVNNLVSNKFWCGTQAQYDALAVKENDVLYLIHE